MSGDRGFTLVELLAALTAGSLLLVALGSSLGGLSRALPVTEETRRRASLQALAPLLAGMVEQAYPPADDGDPVITEAKQLVLIVPPPLAAGNIGAVKLALDVRSLDEGVGLIARLEPLDSSVAFPAAARREHLLAGGFAAIDITYEGVEPKRLPRLITFSFTEQAGARHRISAIPRTDSGGHCRFDPISMACRP